MKLKVLCPFRDKSDHKTSYKAGDTLVVDDIARINDMIKRGFCEMVSLDDGDAEQEAPVVVTFCEKEYALAEIKAALEAIAVPVNANAKAKGVTKVLGMLTEEQVAALQKALGKQEE